MARRARRREIYFAQEHPPGRLRLSDFNVADELDISRGGLAFPHRLYQFALAQSGWRHARVLLGGEIFRALAAGLQDALWIAGAVPEEHRTNSRLAAFNNLVLDRRIDGCKVNQAGVVGPISPTSPRENAGFT